ncbi:MAG TPA: hypothetical protein PLP17_08680, partial [Oligoflexia bacterium]|nr:hypothetical protein [Oligoflexia bacterium]
ALNANDKAAVKHDDRPIYLLNSVVYRTEDQNKLTFLGKTAFDLRATAKLAEQYLGVARELEQILSYVAQDDALDLPDDILPQAMEQLQGLDRRWNSTKMRSGSTC